MSLGYFCNFEIGVLSSYRWAVISTYVFMFHIQKCFKFLSIKNASQTDASLRLCSAVLISLYQSFTLWMSNMINDAHCFEWHFVFIFSDQKFPITISTFRKSLQSSLYLSNLSFFPSFYLWKGCWRELIDGSIKCQSTKPHPTRLCWGFDFDIFVLEKVFDFSSNKLTIFELSHCSNKFFWF